MYDYFLEDPDEANDYDELDDLQKLIVDWCKDDSGKNILYKKSGEERYPEFKLYKMIARNVHNHTPQKQLERQMFSKYVVSRKSLGKKIKVVNVDNIPYMG